MCLQYIIQDKKLKIQLDAYMHSINTNIKEPSHFVEEYINVTKKMHAAWELSMIELYVYYYTVQCLLCQKILAYCTPINDN